MIDSEIFNCHYTDSGNAEALALLFGDKLRYVHNIGWHVWNGQYWRPDEDHKVTEFVKELAKERQMLVVELSARDKDDSAGIIKNKMAKAFQLENKGKIANCLKMAESAPPFSTLSNELDSHPMLLSCPNGTVDLETGKLRSASPDDLITNCTSVNYVPGATAPRWEKFLDEIFILTPGMPDYELIDWVQRLLGYVLTGRVNERCLPVGYGEGANGKSTLIDTISHILGSYSGTASFTNFLERQLDGSTNDVAAMRGKRFVSAIETGPGKYLDEVKVKQLTGGDPISCRFLYHEYFQYYPTFKIFLACNDKPKIRGTDNAIWDRLKVVPFNARFVGKTQDKYLLSKLISEAEGILAWMVKGCLMWQEHGLGECDAVRLTSKSYRTDEDAFARFLQERVEHKAGAFTAVQKVFLEYGQWARANGEKELTTANRVGMEMSRRGYQSVHKNNVRGYHDIAIPVLTTTVVI